MTTERQGRRPVLLDWKRFWFPRGDLLHRFGGYLPDPEQADPYGRYRSRAPVSYNDIAHHPCLVLLGEPGIGKTTAMHMERASIEAALQAQGHASLWLDLRSCPSDAVLLTDLFNDPRFVAWASGAHRLYLFLDSLDESLLHIANLAPFLSGRLERYPRARLYLRIACRTADWPQSFEDELRRLWGEDNVAAYELAPLRAVDVAEAAAARGVDAEAFLDAVDRAGVVPLAIKPVTLTLLLNIYARTGGRLPETQAQLYEDGCRLLCEETNPYRREAGVATGLDTDRRLAIAARVAAATVFGNRYAIWTSVDQGDVPEGDITVRQLCGTEVIGGDAQIVGPADIADVLGTGLFSSRGPHRMGWAHQTYAEPSTWRRAILRLTTCR